MWPSASSSESPEENTEFLRNELGNLVAATSISVISRVAVTGVLDLGQLPVPRDKGTTTLNA
jgi:hypothetical protein